MRTAILLLSLAVAVPVAAKDEKTLLAFFAHPDDETVVGEVLLRYTTLGYRVHVMLATDGNRGTRVTQVPAGDELGALRRDESRCAAKALGIEPPIFLGVDRLDTQIGTGAYFKQHARLLTLLAEQVPAIDPDVIITFGPDGDTSHSEHIVAGAAMTELLLREGWVDRYPLYYVAWTKAQAEGGELGWVRDDYFNVRIEYTQAEEDKALGMMPCYVTQFTPEEIAEDRRSKLADKSNAMHFRRFVVDRTRRDTF